MEAGQIRPAPREPREERHAAPPCRLLQRCRVQHMVLVRVARLHDLAVPAAASRFEVQEVLPPPRRHPSSTSSRGAAGSHKGAAKAESFSLRLGLSKSAVPSLSPLSLRGPSSPIDKQPRHACGGAHRLVMQRRVRRAPLQPRPVPQQTNPTQWRPGAGAAHRPQPVAPGAATGRSQSLPASPPPRRHAEPPRRRHAQPPPPRYGSPRHGLSLHPPPPRRVRVACVA